MAKQIAKLLKADLNATSNLAMIAKMLEKKGRANDTILAHITQKEAELLKEMGGAGTVNPETGLLEFYDGEGYDTFAPTSTDYGAFGEAPLSAGREVTPVTVEAPVSADVSATPAAAPIEGRYSFGEAGGSSGLQPGSYADTTFAYGLSPSATGIQPPSQAFATRELPVSPISGAGISTDAARAAPAALAEKPPAAPEKSFLDKLSTDQLVRLGLVGGLGMMGAQKAKTGARQAQAAAQEEKAIGAPYQAKGAELQRAAQAGELTATGQQSLQALQARLAQGVESRGGVGVAQAAAQAEAYRQQLLAQQYNLGLQVSQIGDNIALGAIRTGLQADQALSQASTNFYTNLAMIGAGIPTYAPTAARGQ